MATHQNIRRNTLRYCVLPLCMETHVDEVNEVGSTGTPNDKVVFGKG